MGKKRLGVVVLLTLFLLIIFKSVWLIPRPIKVSFDSELQNDIRYQIFYTMKSRANFTETNSIKKTVVAGSQKVTFYVPIRKMEAFRLDFDETLGNVKISNLKISGLTQLNFTNFDDFDFTNIDQKEISDNQLVIKSTQKDPHIVYQKRFKIRNSYQVDGYFLVIILTLSFLFSYKVVKYLSKFKLLEHNSRIDIVFVCVFVAILFVPMSHISERDRDMQENRMLAPYPHLWQGKKINLNFGEAFEKWFNDHFNGRKEMIKSFNKIKLKLTPAKGNELVLIGQDGWWFYKGDNGLKNFQNINILSDNELQNGLKYLTDLNDWCKKHHKKFYYIIAPDKNKIYGEYFSLIKKLKPDTEGLGYQFVNYIKEKSDIDALYLYETLMAQKGENLLYYKEDTHWNLYGAYWGYREIIKHIQKDFSSLKMYEIDKWKLREKTRGDLFAMYAYKDPNSSPTFYKEPEHTRDKDCTQKKLFARNEWDITCNNKDGDLRVFVLRDSFSTALSEYYARTFQRVKMLWTYQITKEYLDLIDQEYDVVILENVERLTTCIPTLKFPKD